MDNIAAARAVDREFNYKNFSSSLGLLGSERGLNRRGAPVGFIWAEFQLKRSHGDPFRSQNNDLLRQVFLGAHQFLLGADQLLLGNDH